VIVPGLCRLTITAQPISQDLESGGTLILAVAIAGATGNVTYQWALDGVDLTDGASGGATISGSTTATLTITAIEAALAGSYTVTMIDDGISDCSLVSDAAVVEVGADCDLEIDENPTGTGYFELDDVELTVTTTGGTGPFTYQWYRNGVALADGGATGGGFISGATTDTLSLTGISNEMAGAYTVTVTDTGVPGECSVTSEAANVYFLYFAEDFEGSNLPPPECFENLGWAVETSTGGEYIANTTTPICETCSLRLKGGTAGQETDASHDILFPQTEAWIHARVRVSAIPATDAPILRIGGGPNPASGELRVIMRSAVNGQTIQITSPGATSVDTIATYNANVAYHFWIYYNSTTGIGWVKFSATGEEPLPGDYMASYTGGSNTAVDIIWLQSTEGEYYDFDTIRWANFTIGDIEC
jgi:hypothetical protein